MNPPGERQVIFTLFFFLLLSGFAQSQNCETFDGFSNCGNNLSDCVADGICGGAFTSPGWENVVGDDIDWSVSDIATLSFGTGPDSDHTSGSGRYLYTEASACYNMTAVLLSPGYDLSAIPNPELQFWYHMFGLDMGSLNVEIESPAGSGSWNNLLLLSGSQGNIWHLSITSLANYSSDSVRFRFTGFTGPAFESDIALDDICVSEGCSLNCDDGDPCTIDFCLNNSCLNQTISCDDADFCTTDTCSSGVCTNTPLDCDDRDPCTFDYCFDGICFSDTPCDDFDACTTDSCDGLGNCFNTAIICDDLDACSFDYCDFGVCFNESLCDDFDACTTDSCDGSGGCISTPIICDDGSNCTNDECISGVCSYIASCNDNDPCSIEECINDSCQFSLAPLCLCKTSGDSVGAMATSINDTIIVSNLPGSILDLNVSVDIGHTFIGDLLVELISPLGTTITLFDGLCGDTSDIQTVFDDEGQVLLCAPSRFLYTIPEEPLSDFKGQAMNGLWILRVSDLFPWDDDGILREWCLLPTLSECYSNSECDDSDLCTNDTCLNGNCAFNPNTNCNIDLSISGSITTETGTLVHTATVSLTGDETDSYITASDGVYNLEVSPGGNYTVTPSKHNDISTNNGISTADILFIRRHILAIVPLSTPYRVIAADVNGSSSVSTADIVLTRRVILQVTDSFPTGNLWAFVPDDHLFADSIDPFPYPNSRTYSDITTSMSDQNFVAIKFGDVNNNWDPNTPKASSVGEIGMKMDAFHMPAGEEISVPMKVKDFHNVTGYQFTVSWDPGILDFIEVSNRMLNGFYGTQKTDQGYLTTSWDDEFGKGITLLDNEAVFELKFKVVGSTGSSSEIKIGSELTMSEAYNENLDLLQVRATKGNVKVGDAPGFVNSQSSLVNLLVQPNPFSNSTNIIFTLLKNESINLSIYDMLGRNVKLVNEDLESGEHQILWYGADKNGTELSKGVYHLRLTAGDSSQSQKLVIIR